jgi:hypothetical protein
MVGWSEFQEKIITTDCRFHVALLKKVPICVTTHDFLAGQLGRADFSDSWSGGLRQ